MSALEFEILTPLVVATLFLLWSYRNWLGWRVRFEGRRPERVVTSQDLGSVHGTITSVVICNQGTGYVPPPTITFIGGGGSE